MGASLKPAYAQCERCTGLNDEGENIELVVQEGRASNLEEQEAKGDEKAEEYLLDSPG